MTTQDLGALGDLLGSIAVFVSLVYRAIQIRDNWSLFVNGLEDFESKTADERVKLSQLFFLVFRNFENMYYQHHRKNRGVEPISPS